jgi:hypothetical protein
LNTTGALRHILSSLLRNTVKLGDKERLDQEQPGVKELFTNYQPFHIINLLLDKERLPMLGNAKTYAKIVKTSKKGDFRKLLDSSWDFTESSHFMKTLWNQKSLH